jgi:hypothetical protein
MQHHPEADGTPRTVKTELESRLTRGEGAVQRKHVAERFVGLDRRRLDVVDSLD